MRKAHIRKGTKTNQPIKIKVWLEKNRRREKVNEKCKFTNTILRIRTTIRSYQIVFLIFESGPILIVIVGLTPL